MIRLQNPSRGTSRPDRPRAFHPSLDGLEDRVLLYSTIGGSWIYPARVTYSILEDGTSIGGTPSNLRQKLSGHSNWEQQIQKAAAVWEAVAGINLVQVLDAGSPIGTGGYQQGDPNSGDIRIGGMSQPGDQLAFAYACQPFNGGAIAGDIFFNTDQWWQTNATTYDLMTVAIHEFGHALGMGHSEISTASMYAGYTSAKQASTSDDSTGLRTVYGGRQSDRFDASTSNNSYTNATDITPYFDGSQRISLAGLDVSSSSDVDWYKVTVPAGGSMTITMQSSRLSSLIPRVTVYNESLQSMGTAAGGRYGDTITVTVSGVGTNQILYIKAMAGVTGSAGIGNYGLQVNVGSDPQAAIAPPYTVVASQPDQNPSSSQMRPGWKIGNEFIPYLGVLDLLGGVNDLAGDPLGGLGVLDGLYLIKYGTLTGYGNAEIIDPSAPPPRAPGDETLSPTGTHATRAEVVIPGSPSSPPIADGRGGMGSVLVQQSGRRGQARAARFEAVDAVRARLRHRRLQNAETPASPRSFLRVVALSRGHLTIPHHLTTIRS